MIHTGVSAAACFALLSTLHASPAQAEDDPALDAAPDTASTPALWVPGVVVLTTSMLAGLNVFALANMYWSNCEDRLDEGGNQASVDGCHQRRTEKTERTAPMLVPVVGPFIVAGTMHDEEDGFTEGMLALGITQVVGAGLIVAGLAARRPVDPASEAPKATVVPVLGPEHAGLAVVGRF